MNDENLKKMMGDIPPATELAKRRTLKESAARFAASGNTKGSRSIRTSNSYRLAALSLTAIAMFTALSYAVTQSSRSGGGYAGKETNLVNSAQLTQYPSGIRTSLVRMIIGGADITKLEFNAPADFASLTSVERGVFHRAGGGATYATAPRDVMANNQTGTWVFNAENQIARVGTTANTATKESVDLIAFLPGISETVCSKLNQELGLPPSPPQVSGVDITTQMTSATPGICNAGCGGTLGSVTKETDLNGQPFGCFSQDGTLVYYHVLVER